MAKKFKVGCRYQVKPEYYNSFYFDISWIDKPKDYIFTVSEVDDDGWAMDGSGWYIASPCERKYCKRIKD
jgi:hypothetical protein